MNMEPKEKAKELYLKFEKLFVDANADSWGNEAKACAIICVDEILSMYAKFQHKYDYWQSVKEEILKQ